MSQGKTLTSDQLAKCRSRAVHLIHHSNLSQAAIAREVGVSRMSVSRWVKTLKQTRRWTLPPARPKGRRSRLSSKEWTQLERLLLRRWLPRSHYIGWARAVWTLPRIQAQVLKRFGVTVSQSTLSRHLRARGWQFQIPSLMPGSNRRYPRKGWLPPERNGTGRLKRFRQRRQLEKPEREAQQEFSRQLQKGRRLLEMMQQQADAAAVAQAGSSAPANPAALANPTARFETTSRSEPVAPATVPKESLPEFSPWQPLPPCWSEQPSQAQSIPPPAKPALAEASQKKGVGERPTWEPVSNVFPTPPLPQRPVLEISAVLEKPLPGDVVGNLCAPPEDSLAHRAVEYQKWAVAQRRRGRRRFRLGKWPWNPSNGDKP